MTSEASTPHSERIRRAIAALGSCIRSGEPMSEAMAETEFYALEALTSLEEQLETLQREHASCHESYDVVLRTWRDRALAAEASSPASEPEAS